MFRVDNDGPEITATNYFETEHAARGYLYLSINAGAFRLLVPPLIESLLAEMRTGKIVVISRGRYQGRDCLEILFDDGSASPFVVTLNSEQCDRLPAGEDSGRDDLLFTVWVGPGFPAGDPRERKPRKVWQARCAYRVVAELPCLEAWKASRSQ